MADPSAHAWLHDSALGAAACVTVVPDATPEEVLVRLGADLTRTVSDDEAADGGAVAATQVPGGVVAVEPLGFQGSRPGTLVRVAGEGRAASVFWDVNALNAFTVVRDGAVAFSVDLLHAEVDDDTGSMTELGLPPELHDLWRRTADDEDRWSVGLAMAEAVTGLTVPRGALESPPTYHPLRADLPADDEPVRTPPTDGPGLRAMRSFVGHVDDLEDDASPLDGTAEVAASVEMAGTPAAVFGEAVFVHGWPVSNGASGAWILEEGNEFIDDATSPDDQFGGPVHGGIFTRIIEIDRPRTITWAWNWLLPDPDGRTRWTSRRVLAHDSTARMTVTRTSARGEAPRALVELVHSGVPAAWSADLQALWTWHLDLRATGDSYW